MRTSIEFLRAEGKYEGSAFYAGYAETKRCMVCNTPVNEAHIYKTTDPDYLRDFLVCGPCHERVQVNLT